MNSKIYGGEAVVDSKICVGEAVVDSKIYGGEAIVNLNIKRNGILVGSGASLATITTLGDLTVLHFFQTTNTNHRVVFLCTHLFVNIHRLGF